MSNTNNQEKYSEIILSSNKRNFGSNETPVFVLEQPLLIQKYKVKSVQIPISYYLINSYNNKIYFTEKLSTVETDCVATLTSGNYTISTLIVELKSQLESSSFNTITYTVEDLPNQNKIKITATKTEELPEFKLVYLNKTNTCDYVIGMTANVDTAYSNIQTSTSTYDLSGTNLIHVCSSSIDSGVDYINSYYNVLATVPITNSFNNVCYAENNGDYIEIQQNISSLTLYLKNEEDKDVDLNGRTWNIILSVVS